MNRADLDKRMGLVLTQLAVCSHVPATSYEPRGRSGATDSIDLSGGDIGTHTHYARRYGLPFSPPTKRFPGAEDDDQRARILDEASAELGHLRGHVPRESPRGESLAERNGRLVREGEGFPAREVAVRFRCGEREVRKAREQAGREPDYGRLPPEEPLAADERRRRVRELANHGHTLAQITRLTGASRSTIERDLGRRTAA